MCLKNHWCTLLARETPSSIWSTFLRLKHTTIESGAHLHTEEPPEPPSAPWPSWAIQAPPPPQPGSAKQAPPAPQPGSAKQAPPAPQPGSAKQAPPALRPGWAIGLQAPPPPRPGWAKQAPPAPWPGWAIQARVHAEGWDKWAMLMKVYLWIEGLRLYPRGIYIVTWMLTPRGMYIVTWMLTPWSCRRVYGETGLGVVDRNDFTYRRKQGRIIQEIVRIQCERILVLIINNHIELAKFILSLCFTRHWLYPAFKHFLYNVMIWTIVLL